MRVCYARGGLSGWLLNRPWLRFDSVLANRLQTTGARRATVMLVMLASVPAGALVAWSVWSGIAEPDDGFYWIFPPQPGFVWAATLILFMLTWPVVQRLLFLSVRSALHLPDAPFDERQQLIRDARAEVAARRLTLLAMGVAGLVGLIVIMIGSEVSQLNLAPMFAWLYTTLFVCAANAHFLVLAWTLRGDDADADAEAEGAE